MNHNFTHLENEVLREIGNIGAGNATTSMAILMDQEVKMEVPYVHLLTINEMIDIVGGPEEVLVTTFFKVEGDITGTVYFLLSIEEATLIVRQMLRDDTIQISTMDNMDEMIISVLKEVANIVVGAYISALADFSNIKISTTVPFISIDMAGATLVTGLIELSQVADHSMMIGTKFSGDDKQKNAQGHFLLVPELDSIPKLFSALGVDKYE